MSTAHERAANYHADRWEGEPSLSSSIAADLILRTPAHAKAKHPRLTDHPIEPGTYAMNLGTTVHAILLHDDRVVMISAHDFRTKAAQEERDAILARGMVPVTPKMWDDANAIADAVTFQLKTRGPFVEPQPTPFTDGQAEYVIRYQDNGANCRAMLDWLRHDRDYIDDLKTTSDGSPGKVRRHIFNMGYDIRAAFYIRAVMADLGMVAAGYPIREYMPKFRWVFVETKPPYPVTIATLTQRALESAWVKVDEAIGIWNECLESGVWPAYQPDTIEVDIPGWQQDASDRWGDVDIESDVPF